MPIGTESAPGQLLLVGRSLHQTDAALDAIRNLLIAGGITVLIGSLPAARLGDVAGCGASIILGALTVEIG